jgi:hypothetical protein
MKSAALKVSREGDPRLDMCYEAVRLKGVPRDTSYREGPVCLLNNWKYSIGPVRLHNGMYQTIKMLLARASKGTIGTCHPLRRNDSVENKSEE